VAELGVKYPTALIGAIARDGAVSEWHCQRRNNKNRVCLIRRHR
jgi:hypothetical protein